MGKVIVRLSSVLMLAGTLMIFWVSLPKAAAQTGTTFIVTNTDDSGPGSLRQAILDANAHPGADTINFNISGAGPHTINLLSPLPDIGSKVETGIWTGKYYADLNSNQAFDSGEYRFTYPNLEEINFNWGTGRPAPPYGSTEPTLPSSDNFLARWTSTITVLQETSYTIQSWSDSGVRVIIDPPGDPDATPGYATSWAWNINDWVDHGYPATPEQAIVTLTTGTHTILVEYYDSGGDARVKVDFSQPYTDNSLIIDGLSQPGASCDSWPPTLTVEIRDGTPNTSIYSLLTLPAGNSTVRGLVVNSFIGHGISLLSDHNVVECNFLGSDVTGTQRIAGDAYLVIGVLVAQGASYNRIGTDGDGTADDAERNLISGNTIGIEITGAGTEYNIVAGNYIGTDITGTLPLPNYDTYYDGSYGIEVLLSRGAQHNLIGTNSDGVADDAERNIIAGNTTTIGISIEDVDTAYNTIAGNYIGTDVTGTLAFGNLTGIRVSGGQAHDNVIGGDHPRAGNIIAYSQQSGIDFESAGNGNTIAHNRIFSNIGMGIALRYGDPTPNDLGDGDTGANELQNYPILTSATTTQVDGSLNSTPNSTFTLHFYSSAICDDTLYGEGEFFQPTTIPAVVTTNANGDATFSFTFSNPVPAAHHITATATNAQGSTSEFSRCTLPLGIAPSFVVTNTSDHDPGSLRAAILMANLAPDQNTITFDIPGTGPHTIAPLSALPTITDSVVIDGTTQPGASCDSWPPTLMIEINGQHAVGYYAVGHYVVDGLAVNASQSMIRGLVINNFGNSGITLSGNGASIIQCNFIGTDVTGTVRAGNLMYGILTTYSNHNIIGTNGDGHSDSTERNLVSANGNGIALNNSTHNWVAGNLIGTDVTGTAALGNIDDGVQVMTGNPHDNIIGTNSDGVSDNLEGNVVADNKTGVFIHAYSQYTIVAGNMIGTDITGTMPLGNQRDGIYVQIYAKNNTIGGPTTAATNIIAFNGQGGILFSNSGANNRASGNRIHSNGRLGIDLAPNDITGVTPNDTGDSDTGPNNLQNYPVLMAASSTVVTGTLNSTPNRTFTLEFFSSTVCDPSGYGEGETFRATTSPATITTNSSGNANFSFTFRDTIPMGHVITATATDSAGNTSEFSACATVSSTGFEVTQTGDSGSGSLGQAILNANAHPGADTITFNIPGTGPRIIRPSSLLPAITDTITIDGCSQPGADCSHWPPTLRVEIDGALITSGLYPTLDIRADGSEVRGLALRNHGHAGIWLNGASNTWVHTNYIGTNTTGTIGSSRDTGVGIIVEGEAHYNVIGTNGDGIKDETERNLISGHPYIGLLIGSILPQTSGPTHNVVAGNLIGRNITNTAPLPNLQGGILIANIATNNLIGTDGDGISDTVERNVISGNSQYGVLVFEAGAINNPIRGNSIYANSGLGVDLGSVGVTFNDPSDSDPGPNNLQNFPVLIGAGQMSVSGTLNSTPNTTFTLEFFSNATCDPSGYGEGEIPQPTTTAAIVTTNASGNASFYFMFNNAIPTGHFLTATATDPVGNTSEFSACAPILSGYVVTTTADSGPGSLRQAIINANDHAGPDTIQFAVSGTITLSTSLPTITSPIIINGIDQSIFVSGNDAVRVFYVESTGDLTLDHLTIQDGKTIADGIDSEAGSGGCIYNNGGTLRLFNSTITSCFTDDPTYTGYGGGALYSSGTTEIDHSALSNNTAMRGFGGAIYQDSGSLTISHSTLSGNHATHLGGGIIVLIADTTISDSTFSENQAQEGGGLFIYKGTTHISSSTINHNWFEGGGGAIANHEGTLEILTSILSHNRTTSGGGDGAGVYNYFGNVTIRHSSIVANDSGDLGDYAAVSNLLGTMLIETSTISDNTAGIFNAGPLTISQSTFYQNDYLNIFNSQVGKITIHNSILIRQPNQVNCQFETGNTFITSAASLSDDATCPGTTQTIAANLRLGTLTGDPAYHPLSAGSAAIDAGDPAHCVTPDQRGFITPVDGDGDGITTCDAGSYEYNSAPITISVNDASVVEGHSGTTELTFALTLSQTSGRSVSVNAATQNGTATSGSDYQPINTTVTFPAGTLSQNVTVTINGDTSNEDDETFALQLSSPDHVALGDSQGTGTITNDDPQAPILIALADGSITNHNSPTFTWTEIPDVVSYRIQIAATSSFDNPALECVVNTLSYTAEITLNDNTLYYWRVQAIAGTGQVSLWSETWSFWIDPFRPTAPVLSAPKDRINTTDTTPTFKWNKVSGATQYRLEVDDDPAFGSPAIIGIDTVITTSYTIPTLNALPYGVYYWRVQAGNAANLWSDWSVVRRFTVTLLKSPANSTHLTDNTPTLSWTRPTGAQAFEFKLDNNAGTVVDPANIGLLTSYTSAVLSDGEYWWSVRVLVGGVWSEWMPAWTFTITAPPTLKPTLLSPTNGFIWPDLAPVFTWGTVTDGHHYQIQIDNDSNFSSPLQDAVLDLGAMTYTATTLPDGGKYYWRVRAINETGVAGAWSSTSNFTLTQLSAPTLTAPANKTTMTDRTPDFAWNGVLNAASYQLQISTDPNFLTITHQGNAGTNNYILPDGEALPDGVYTWRVRAVNAANIPGKWSSKFSFTVDNVGPATPVLNTPAMLSGTSDTTPSFSWRSASGGKGYHLQVTTLADPDFAAIPLPIDRTGTTTSYTTPTALGYGVYLWRVRAQDALGNWGEFSPANRFAITLHKTPKDGSSTTSLRPTFTWNAQLGAALYDFELDDDINFGSPVWDYTPSTAKTAKPAADLTPGTYYWHVRAQVSGVWQPWMPTWTVILTPPLPGKPVLTTPVNKALLSDSTPTLNWNIVTGVTKYQVQIDNTTDFSSPAQDVQVSNLLNYIASELPDGKYVWRVRAINTVEAAGPWSTVFTLTIDTTPPAVPVILAPVDGTSMTNTKFNLAWNKVSDAARYEVQIDLDDDFPLPPSDVGSKASYKPATPLARGDYFWRVRAIDKAGNVSVWTNYRTFKIVAGITSVEPTATPTPEIVPTEATVEPTAEPTLVPTEPPTIIPPTTPIYTLESDDTAVTQVGSWTAHDTPYASSGRYLYSSGSLEDALTFTFSGAQLDVIYVQHPALGQFVVEVDGAPLLLVDACAAEAVFDVQQTISFSAGQHTVRLYPLAGTIAIEAFIVQQTPAIPPVEPTVIPTLEPTSAPTAAPTDAPPLEPTVEPTPLPTSTPIPLLLPFGDSFDSGLGWTANSAWLADTQTSHSGAGWWADSTQRGQISTLTYSGFIDLRTAQYPQLGFWQRGVLSSADVLSVEVSLDGGLMWWPALRQSNLSTDWMWQTVDLSAYRGNIISLRFVLNTVDPLPDGATTAGFGLDDLLIQDVPLVPTVVPTLLPTDIPTEQPTLIPTVVPTDVPTLEPTSVPTGVPTEAPPAEPTIEPTPVPTEVARGTT